MDGYSEVAPIILKLLFCRSHFRYLTADYKMSKADFKIALLICFVMVDFTENFPHNPTLSVSKVFSSHDRYFVEDVYRS